MFILFICKVAQKMHYMKFLSYFCNNFCLLAENCKEICIIDIGEHYPDSLANYYTDLGINRLVPYDRSAWHCDRIDRSNRLLGMRATHRLDLVSSQLT